MKSIKGIWLFVVTAVIFAAALPAQAGLVKWLKKEAIPTLKGDRPLEIKPYVSVKSDKVELRLGVNEAKIQIGDVKIQTHQLAKRLVQAGCVYATGGDVLHCAPDVVERELLNIADGLNPSSPQAQAASSFPNYPTRQLVAPQEGLLPGTPMQACGCWGFNPPPFAFEPRCAQSRVVVAQCAGFCPAGGFPYGFVCM